MPRYFNAVILGSELLFIRETFGGPNNNKEWSRNGIDDDYNNGVGNNVNNDNNNYNNDDNDNKIKNY